MAFKSTCQVLKKVEIDEPIFVLRAKDCSAPNTILFWLQQNPQLSDARRREAMAAYDDMMTFPSNRKKSAT